MENKLPIALWRISGALIVIAGLVCIATVVHVQEQRSRTRLLEAQSQTQEVLGEASTTNKDVSTTLEQAVSRLNAALAAQEAMQADRESRIQKFREQREHEIETILAAISKRNTELDATVKMRLLEFQTQNENLLKAVAALKAETKTLQSITPALEATQNVR